MLKQPSEREGKGSTKKQGGPKTKRLRENIKDKDNGGSKKISSEVR